PVRRAAMSARARQRMIDHFRIDQFGERIEMLIRRASDPAARSDRPIPTEGEAARSASDAINLARQSQNVARLWQIGGYADDVPLPPARRAALQIMRIARQRLRPWYRRLVNRDGHPLSRGVVAVRDWIVEWVYREG
ncbi:MAG: glycosyltransferase family 1 protein, partial [Roseiflexaceae bacterium]|nr:glycosyltransferase family 1 protein [Roseiflexaceae bacterium]